MVIHFIRPQAQLCKQRCAFPTHRHPHRWTSSSTSPPELPPIPQLDRPTLQQISNHILTSSTPLLIHNLVDTHKLTGWTSAGRWASLADPPAGLLDVRVELCTPGRGYNSATGYRPSLPSSSSSASAPSHTQSDQADFAQLRMPLALFIEAFLLRQIPWSSPSSGTQQRPIGYVAQSDLLSSCPSLLAEVKSWGPPLPTAESNNDDPHEGGTAGGSQKQKQKHGNWLDSLLSLARDRWGSSLWLGPAGTYTPPHTDPYHNFYLQVDGTKRLLLFPPTSQTLHALGLPPSSTGMQNTSPIPTEAPFLAHDPHWPLASRVERWTVELSPGEVLWIPKGVWHAVSGVGDSCSLNWWFL